MTLLNYGTHIECKELYAYSLSPFFRVKGHNFNLPNLLQDNDLAEKLDGGSLAIFRLAPQDYHRFHMPAKGTIKSIQSIKGTYYTGKEKKRKKS